MLFGDFKESKPSPEIIVDSWDLEDFMRFIDYIYYADNDKLNHLHIDALKNLYFIADHFMVLALKNSCLNVISAKIGKMSTRDLVSAFEFSQQIAEKSVSKKIVQSFRAKGAETCPGIYVMDVEIFYEFLVQMQGVLGEVIRFDMIETYAKMNNLLEMESSIESTAVEPVKTVAVKDPLVEGNAGNFRLFCGKRISKAEIVKLLLRSINFTSMTTQEFCNGPGKSVLLNTEEKYEIIDSLVNKNG